MAKKEKNKLSKEELKQRNKTLLIVLVSCIILMIVLATPFGILKAVGLMSRS